MPPLVGKTLSKLVKMLYVVVGDELAPTPEDLAEEEERVEAVGEANDQANDLASGAVLLLDVEHPRQSWREMLVAGGEEEVGEVDRKSVV